MKTEIFKEATDIIWNNRFCLSEDFDYPEYGDLPERISVTFSPEAVDAMQYIWGAITSFKTKKDFISEYKKTLFELGEAI